MNIIGIDPGLNHTGWGVIDYNGGHMRFVAAGVIAPTIPVMTGGESALAVRLAHLFQALHQIIRDYAPAQAAVEETFANVNPVSTLRLGHARAAAMLVPALANIPVFEYTANKVKKAVTSNGHADKNQVQMMVRRLLPASATQSADAADALAVAICHAHSHRLTAQTG
ncbi:MAG: crossover junction endodeoxyribonuclease RuvC [Candidatus Symbiobacter sp.]|nr:crossover junction endodeoxyribonuclease RuvC [Candidatus Symbiobacter sp.]